MEPSTFRLPTDKELTDLRDAEFGVGQPGSARVDADPATGRVDVLLFDGQGEYVGTHTLGGPPGLRQAPVPTPIDHATAARAESAEAEVRRLQAEITALKIGPVVAPSSSDAADHSASALASPKPAVPPAPSPKADPKPGRVDGK